MGLIAARPEEPDEWMGIPSEPRDIDTGVDRLDTVSPSASDALGLLGSTVLDGTVLDGTAIESIAVPIVPDVESSDPPPHN